MKESTTVRRTMLGWIAKGAWEFSSRREHLLLNGCKVIYTCDVFRHLIYVTVESKDPVVLMLWGRQFIRNLEQGILEYPDGAALQ